LTVPAHLRLSLPQNAIGDKIVDGDRYHVPTAEIAGHHADASTVVIALQHVVCQERFLDISACAEQRASRDESLGDFGADQGADRRYGRFS